MGDRGGHPGGLPRDGRQPRGCLGGDGQECVERVGVAVGPQQRPADVQPELEAGPVAGLRAFLALWRGIVVESDFRAGCPVLAVSVEEPPAGEIPPELLAAAEMFEDWERLFADALGEHGVAPEQGQGLAALVVAAAEGATVMCRAKRSTQPLDQVAQQLEGLIAGVLDPSS
ncbi:LmrA/YxaF family transcription factor [Streptomyces mirabilis]|uniref:LmrA/YxaF family transcription factor n=1 Tax=Streptomyces mirabilis TaxID=68239 RepID=UPI0033A21A60